MSAYEIAGLLLIWLIVSMFAGFILGKFLSFEEDE